MAEADNVDVPTHDDEKAETEEEIMDVIMNSMNETEE